MLVSWFQMCIHLCGGKQETTWVQRKQSHLWVSWERPGFLQGVTVKCKLYFVHCLWLELHFIGSYRYPGNKISLTRESAMLQYSCLENSTDRGAWKAVVHGVTKRDTTLRARARAHTHTHTHTHTHNLLQWGWLFLPGPWDQWGRILPRFANACILHFITCACSKSQYEAFPGLVICLQGHCFSSLSPPLTLSVLAYVLL